ncbi:MAG: M3 family metallopeptidase [Bacteroidota bacterium]|nr:M3 family metallopeptidase [Bacteroidota bacterium]
MKNLLYILLIMSVITTAFKPDKDTPKTTSNPLLTSYNTPFGVPPFDKIKTKYFLPAFKTAIKKHNKEIEVIIKNPSKPTFANTVEAMENSGILLGNISSVFFNINSANTNDTIQKIAQEVTPLLSKHEDDILFNASLYRKVKAVYDQKKSLKLTPEQSKLLDETYKSFIRNGAALDTAKQNRLRKINEDLSMLMLKFGENLLAETNSFKLVIDKKEDLAGLPQGIIDAAAEVAKKEKLDGKWVFTLHNPSVMPFLQYADNRSLREKIFNGYINRGNNNNTNDNKVLIKKIIVLRIEKANMLGFDTYANYVLDRTMAKNQDNVYKLLNQIWAPALKMAKNEASDMQSLINREGGNFKLAAWDWRYYAEKVRKEKYAFDDEALRSYFKLENVRQGVFYTANKLYGLTFTELKNVPKYHPDVMVYDVKNANGVHLAVLYMDFFARNSKRGGAWMTSFREQYRQAGKNIPPVISIVCNFPKPTADKPSLLNLDEVTTLFHEFGHSLHGMLSKCTYRSLSGTSVPRDFVELPSQVNENWATEPEVLKIYAKHYQTGEIIPQALLDKMKNSQYFNQGFATVELTAASLLDMDYHTLKDAANLDLLTFEKQSLDKIGLIPEIVSRYRTTYFNHIFNGGYSAGYYSYLWAEVLDADAFEAFKEHGIFDPETARSFRQNVLEKGGTEDPMVLYKRFRGADPSIMPLLKRRGLMQ